MVSLFMSCRPPQRKIIFIFAALTALMITIILNVTGKPLITPEAPAGIVSFELAGTISQAQIILDSWDGQAKLFAAFSLGFDYLYMVAYAVAIGLGCVLASLVIGERGWPFGGLGAPLAVCLWVAAGFDALENLALSVVLLGGATAEAWPALARICALVKFSLILIGLVYLIYGLIGWLAGRQTR